MLYDTRVGYLYDTLRYRAQTKNGQISDNFCDEIDDEIETGSQNLLDEQEKDKLLQFFKNCVVDENKEELKRVLATCVEFRSEILKNPPLPIYKIFPFYFVDPELVIQHQIHVSKYHLSK